MCVTVAHETVLHYKQDLTLTFQFLKLVKSHYENLPLITEVNQVGWWDSGKEGWWDGGMVGWWDGGMEG